MTKTILVIIALALTACTDTAGPARVREMCGDPPDRAEYTVSYARSSQGVTATMPQADFAALIVERDLARDWMLCAADLESK